MAIDRSGTASHPSLMHSENASRLTTLSPQNAADFTIVHIFRDPEISGSQRVALDILGSPALSHYRRVVICGTEAAASHQFVSELASLGIERVHVKRLCREVGPSDLLLFFDLLRELKALRPALVHTHSAKPFLLAGVAAWLLRVRRRVHTLHGITFHRFMPTPSRAIFYVLEQLASLCYQRLISVNFYYRRYFPLARALKSFQVIPNGISLPTQTMVSVTRPGRDFPILFAGRLDEQKDPLFVLDVADAISRYWRSELVPRFYIAGSGPLSARVSSEIAARNLQDRVITLGWITDLSDRYVSAKVLLLPSRWEACGLVLIEAAAHGCPAIAASVEGVPEVIRHGFNGLLFQQGNVAEACKYIALLAQDEDYRQRLADQARNYARTRGKETMITSYLGVYRKLGLNI